MKALIPLAFFLTLAACHRVPDAPVTPEEPPPLTSLTEHPVVGALGIPLGTYAEIRATIVAGGAKRRKYQAGYLLSVTEVNGHPLAPPPVMEFVAPDFTGVKLARDPFELYEFKMGTMSGPLDSEQIEDLQKGYVGKVVRLAVYECGGYSGIPSNLPNGFHVWQDHGFGFTTWLVVLAKQPN